MYKKGQGNEWDWDVWCETHREPIKSYKKKINNLNKEANPPIWAKSNK